MTDRWAKEWIEEHVGIQRARFGLPVTKDTLDKLTAQAALCYQEARKIEKLKELRE